MKIIQITVFILLSSLTLHAQKIAKPDKLITYKTVGKTKLKLHVFSPKDIKDGDQRPVIIYFFGGGWGGGHPKQFYKQAAECAERGIVSISAEYRISNKHKTTPFECVEDGKSAIRWVRKHATELKINPQKIIAAGGSAGGHVAICTSIIKNHDDKNDDLSISCNPNAIILYNAVLDTTERGYGAKRFTKEKQTELSPCHQVTTGLPATLLLHGTADSVVPFENAERFTQLMNKAKNHCELITYKGADHGFFNNLEFRPKNNANTYKATMDETFKFLAKFKLTQ